MFKRNSITWLGGARRRALVALVVVAALSLSAAAPAAADEPFQLRYNAERTGTGSVRVTGSVTNGGRLDALDVYVTAEALDAAGRVLARGISFVSQSLPQRETATFIVSVPAQQTATSFRVHVSSFRFGHGAQAS